MAFLKEKSSLNIEMFFDEPGEPRCSNLDLPLLTSESLMEVVMIHLECITAKQWTLLAVGKVDSDTIVLLCDLCDNIVETVYNLVLEVVAPQVCDWTSGQSSEARASDHSSASDPVNGIEWNFHTVTEEDVQASLGDSLHRCLGEPLDVKVERSGNSEQLLLLVAEVVANKVNRKLADVPQPSSSQQPEKSSESLPTDMVYHVAKILESCLSQNFSWDFADPCSLNEDDMEEKFSTQVTQGSLTSVIPFSCEKEFSQGDEIAAVAGGTALGEAVTGELTGQLQKASRKPLSFVDRVRRYCRRKSSKQAPACEVACLEKGSTPPPQKRQKRPSVMRMFSAMARILRKLFPCHLGGSQDD